MESILGSIKGTPGSEFRAELQSFWSQMKPGPSGPKEPDWPSLEQLPPAATFEGPSPMDEATGTQGGSSYDEALEGEEECGGDPWEVPPHLLRPRFQEETQQVAILSPAPSLNIKRPVGVAKWEAKSVFLKRKVEAWISQSIPRLPLRSKDNVNEKIFRKNSSEMWPKMAPRDVEFAARCQADDHPGRHV
jgi:hypothetical protein